MDNKPLYDYSVKYDYSHLHNSLQEYIKKLEEYDKLHDWFNYDIIFDMLEIDAKSYLIDKLISEKYYDLILKKYGWFV